jgi:hypothetical protein
LTVVTPSVFVMPKLAVGVNVSTSVAALFPVLGSTEPEAAATVAVFDKLPVAVDAIDAVTVNVTDPPDGMLTVLLILPVPIGDPQVAPPEPEQVQVPVIDAGKVSFASARKRTTRVR